MGFYRTCARCAFEKTDCARRAEVAARVKGAGLTSVTFRCSARAPLYRPGQRVTVTWPVYDHDASYEDRGELESWPATVVQESSKGFVILVDDVDSDFGTPARGWIKSDSLFCSVRVGKLAPLDEPDRRTCPLCRGPQAADGSVPGCFEPGAEADRGKCIATKSLPAAREETPADELEGVPF